MLQLPTWISSCHFKFGGSIEVAAALYLWMIVCVCLAASACLYRCDNLTPLSASRSICFSLFLFLLCGRCIGSELGLSVSVSLLCDRYMV